MKTKLKQIQENGWSFRWFLKSELAQGETQNYFGQIVSIEDEYIFVILFHRESTQKGYEFVAHGKVLIDDIAYFSIEANRDQPMPPPDKYDPDLLTNEYYDSNGKLLGEYR
ncbi:hypothetical protein FWH30_00695 [Microgenomates group bacterium]|nr:hypothetical protein [Microgenomates group bacterium]